MRVRALDSDHDFEYGKGQNDYKTQNNAIAQNIQTRLLSFYGNCFFDGQAGIDWFTYLAGSKNELAVSLAISAMIIGTDGVTGILQLSITLDRFTRKLRIAYKATTVYSTITGLFTYDLNGIN